MKSWFNGSKISYFNFLLGGKIIKIFNSWLNSLALITTFRNQYKQLTECFGACEVLPYNSEFDLKSFTGPFPQVLRMDLSLSFGKFNCDFRPDWDKVDWLSLYWENHISTYWEYQHYVLWGNSFTKLGKKRGFFAIGNIFFYYGRKMALFYDQFPPFQVMTDPSSSVLEPRLVFKWLWMLSMFGLIGAKKHKFYLIYKDSWQNKRR